MDLEKMKMSEIVDLAQITAEKLKQDRVKTNQIRNFYSSIAKMRTDFAKNQSYSDIEIDLILLKPKLAYAAGRQKDVKKTFQPFMTEAIQSVESASQGRKKEVVEKFFALVESVVAYHKFYGDN